jgi:hypothetical protein
MQKIRQYILKGKEIFIGLEDSGPGSGGKFVNYLLNDAV